ncbi:Exo-poly-alpha-D-galacturonosidase precursor [Mucilaginibacter gotjawali]|uniref:Exo-poly-alpha-D-galacturonosidase n=1 Tax=Mucilaginibacter gotjawali TaxID=1550579 RepID=A0A125T276_9SPHI|nr:glycosyl hydrolase family 28-related protein [Mucilaginibacter gotjawali]BAU52550.1 Exo-poly-alpha-D-galacturonosidase precursor [Mucilaginibacter gotjawali]
MGFYLRNLLLMLCLCGTSALAQTFNIREYGALNDGKTVCTAAIQKAVDACYQNGGGRVYVPAGQFITGTVHLKSNVNLCLESGAVLLGSPNLQDYESYTKAGYGINYYGILYTADAENVSISGSGAIDGNNKVFLTSATPKRSTPTAPASPGKKIITAMWKQVSAMAPWCRRTVRARWLSSATANTCSCVIFRC